MRLFVGNFDFEHQLDRVPRGGVPEPVRRLNAELTSSLALVADDDDFLWTPDAFDDGFAAHLASMGLARVRCVGSERDVPAGAELSPWGWSDPVKSWGERFRWTCAGPPVSAVRDVNSRRFSFALERELGVGLPGACAVSSLEELEAAVRATPTDDDAWVVKSAFGMSARERIVGRGRVLSETQINWARRRLAGENQLFYEPWVERVAEAGLQFEIPRQGTPRVEGVTPLLCDVRGQYLGSRFSAETHDLADWSETIEIGREVAARVQRQGYFGPMGIDAMRYRDREQGLSLRPIQDLNARWTMGRVALGLRRLLSAGSHGSWLHVPLADESPDAALRRMEQMLPAGVRLARTSPMTVGGRPPLRLALVLIAGSERELLAAEQQVLDLSLPPGGSP